MKKIRYLLPLLLCFLFLISGCNADVPHGQSPEDTGAGKEIPPLLLAGEGAPAYTIVRGDTSDKRESAAAVLLMKYMNACGFSVSITTDWEKNPVSDYEIVVGDTLRASLAEDPLPDVHELGEKGYFIRVCGSRVFIAGGSPDATYTAVERFMTEFLSYTGDPEKAAAAASVSVPGDYACTEKQQFAISSVSVGDTPLGEYYITWDGTLTRYVAKAYAETIQNYFYKTCGIWMDIDEPREGAEHALILSLQKGSGRDLFSIRAEGNDLQCTVWGEDAFALGFSRFTEKYFESSEGAVKLEKNLHYAARLGEALRYSEFGARGDGVTNDIEAIVAAHEYANLYNLPVRADEGATYYIGQMSASAVVRTDTDWSGATFIVDNAVVPIAERGKNVFDILSSKSSYKTTIPGSLKKGQTNIGITLPEDSVVLLMQEGVKHYIRKGVNANDGSDQQELIVVDKNGNVDPNTPIIWDYEKVSSVTVIPMDKTPLTVKGGTFITLVDPKSNAVTETDYTARGIRIYRSNVILEGVSQYVKNDFAEASRYVGFVSVTSCANVEVRGCTFTPLMTIDIQKETGSAGKGTYAISVTRAVNVTFRDCVQTVDINDKAYWGLMGSNFCKNLVLDGCEFSRFDAHQGVANVTVRNSKLGYQCMSTIGSGLLLLENTTLCGDSLITLRSDYGSTWDGKAVIRNCTWIPKQGGVLTAKGVYPVFSASNAEDHDFGYPCCMPADITIENLYVDDSNAQVGYNGVYIFTNVNPKRTSEAAENSAPYPYTVPEKLTISGFSSASGKKWNLSTNMFMFRSVEVYDADAGK